MALAKIKEFTREFVLSGTSSSNQTITIDAQDLGLTGGDLYGNSGDRDGAYYLEAIAIRVAGSNSRDGSIRQTGGFTSRNDSVQAVGVSALESYGFNQATFSFGQSGGNLQVTLQHPANVNTNATTVRYYVFIKVYAFGEDGIPASP